jgi:uncharacterized protein
VAQNESFDIAGPAGRLEAILMHPEGPPAAAAVVCHAHPLHGGIMHFKPVFRAAKVMQAHGLAALRFNFRGVGTSEGVHDDGRGEQDDVRTALDECARRFPGLPLVVGGFSFGSVMAQRVAGADDRVRASFALGYPVRSVGDTSYLENVRKPRLFVQGENDVFGDGSAIRALVEPLTDRPTLVVVPGSDHYFNGHLEPMQQALSAWMDGRPWA